MIVRTKHPPPTEYQVEITLSVYEARLLEAIMVTVRAGINWNLKGDAERFAKELCIELSRNLRAARATSQDDSRQNDTREKPYIAWGNIPT